MSKLVANYVDRYIKRYHSKMRQICDPLQRFFGINYFTYHSLTPDGYWRPFVSRPDWADYFTDNQMYLHDPFLLHPRSYRSGAVFWTPLERNQLTKSLFLKQIRAELPIKLSKREKECLNLYLDDQKMQDVADKLELSVRTIEFYLANIKNKLNCSNKIELIKKGQELRALGILP